MRHKRKTTSSVIATVEGLARAKGGGENYSYHDNSQKQTGCRLLRGGKRGRESTNLDDDREEDRLEPGREIYIMRRGGSDEQGQ